MTGGGALAAERCHGGDPQGWARWLFAANPRDIGTMCLPGAVFAMPAAHGKLLVPLPVGGGAPGLAYSQVD